jgi:hypothetical protein
VPFFRQDPAIPDPELLNAELNRFKVFYNVDQLKQCPNPFGVEGVLLTWHSGEVMPKGVNH